VNLIRLPQIGTARRLDSGYMPAAIGMDIAPPPLNVLCELCKANFPEGQPWECFAAGTAPDFPPFRSSSIKQIRESVALGCHACSILWNTMQDWDHDDEDFTDIDIYYLTAELDVGLSDPGSRIIDNLRLHMEISSRGWLGPSLHLSRVNSIRKRVIEEENIWEIELADDANRMIGNAATQCCSLVNVGQRIITQISKWLTVCENDHECCRIKTAALPTSGAHGFRLINVGDGSVAPVHLVHTDRLRHLPRYITLSHRWTEATKLTQLTWTNLDRHFTNIDTSQWPQVYKDAVTFTRQLRIQYLWVDSICIIQDARKDVLQQDWDKQSVLMDQIYANGVLNLASIEEKDGEGFKTKRNLLSEFPCVLRGGAESDGFTTSSYLLCSSEDERNAVSNAPLSKRGWVYQERMLSRRTVHFGCQIYWDCASLSANEAFPSGYDIHEDGPYAEMTSLSIKRDLQWRAGLRHNRTDQTPLHVLWKKIVNTYTATELSNPNDRLVALRGIVNIICGQYNVPDVDYAAGMWRKNLPSMMVWRRDVDFEMAEVECAARRTLLHYFPSWSWASCNSKVYLIKAQRYAKELISVESIHGSDDKTRTAVPAEIILHGLTDTVKPFLFTNSPMHGNRLQLAMSDPADRVWIHWDAPIHHVSEPWYLLPVIDDKYVFQGLVLQRVATKDAIPTFSRVGYYYSVGHDPVLGVKSRQLEKGEDWDAKLLLAPLIRLV
jgi:hypothetical protein